MLNMNIFVFKNRLKEFILRERITLLSLGDPFFVFRLLVKTNYLLFFLVGISGVVLNLAITWYLTEFVFGRELYFDAYLIGLGVTLCYLFTLHTFITFNTKDKHIRRFVLFITYSLVMSGVQAFLVKTITPIVGIHYYLVVIASIILIFSTVTFLLFKLALFRE